MSAARLLRPPLGRVWSCPRYPASRRPSSFCGPGAVAAPAWGGLRSWCTQHTGSLLCPEVRAAGRCCRGVVGDPWYTAVGRREHSLPWVCLAVEHPLPLLTQTNGTMHGEGPRCRFTGQEASGSHQRHSGWDSFWKLHVGSS